MPPHFHSKETAAQAICSGILGACSMVLKTTKQASLLLPARKLLLMWCLLQYVKDFSSWEDLCRFGLGRCSEVQRRPSPSVAWCIQSSARHATSLIAVWTGPGSGTGSQGSQAPRYVSELWETLSYLLGWDLIRTVVPTSLKEGRCQLPASHASATCGTWFVRFPFSRQSPSRLTSRRCVVTGLGAVRQQVAPRQIPHTQCTMAALADFCAAIFRKPNGPSPVWWPDR